MKLHLGCGTNYKGGFINVDDCKRIKADVYHNLNKFPYPFKENSVDYILIEHTLEHLEKPLKALEEFYRICKNKAIIKIKVPHFSFFLSYHITHTMAFSRNALCLFEDKSGHDFSTEARFKLISNDLNWTNRRCPKIINKSMNYLINKILKIKKLDIYERFFCWLIPAEEITFILQAQKKF